jgi:hypothetical protein
VNVDDAGYATVHDYPGGSESLAPRMGMSAAILRGKVNPNDRGHHLTLAEADRMIGLTCDLRILQALAAQHRQVVLPIDEGDDASDMAVLEAIAAMWSSNGDLGTAVHRALSDNVLTRRELDGISAAAHKLTNRVFSMLARLEGMVEPEGSTHA